MPIAPDCLIAERIRDALLVRLDQHFDKAEVQADLMNRLGVVQPVLIRIVQRVAEELFPESFDLDREEPRRRGIVSRRGLERISKTVLGHYAESLLC